jgi:hypothetical protein
MQGVPTEPAAGPTGRDRSTDGRDRDSTPDNFGAFDDLLGWFRYVDRLEAFRGVLEK